MFSRENLKLEDKEMPQEDFDDEPNRRFLDEVYSVIKVRKFFRNTSLTQISSLSNVRRG